MVSLLFFSDKKSMRVKKQHISFNPIACKILTKYHKNEGIGKAMTIIAAHCPNINFSYYLTYATFEKQNFSSETMLTQQE